MNDPIVVTRDLVKRAAGDIETKIGWAFASGAAASFALQLANAYGIDIPPAIQVEIPYIFAIIGGYWKSSAGVKVVTTRDTATGKVVTEESHSAPAIVTASVPVQTTSPVEAPGAFTQTLTGQRTSSPDAETVKIPDIPQVGSAFLSARGMTLGPHSDDDH